MMKRLYSAVWHFLLFNSKVNFFIYVVLDYSLYSLTLKKKKKKKSFFFFSFASFSRRKRTIDKLFIQKLRTIYTSLFISFVQFCGVFLFLSFSVPYATIFFFLAYFGLNYKQ